MSVPLAKQDPQLRRYPLRRLRVPMARGNLSLVVVDEGAWLRSEVGTRRALAANQLGVEPPYWASVWPASIALARWLCRRTDLAGRRVLDLGCGLGVPGAAAARGGADVTFADCEAEALGFAAFNARSQGSQAPVAVVEMDWRSRTVEGQFDIVCLSDVTYRPCHHLPVRRHLEACLADGGLAVHTDPFRRESDGFLQRIAESFPSRQLVQSTFFAERRQSVRMTFLAADAQDLQRWLDPATDCAHGSDTLPPAQSSAQSAIGDT